MNYTRVVFELCSVLTLSLKMWFGFGQAGVMLTSQILQLSSEKKKVKRRLLKIVWMINLH